MKRLDSYILVELLGPFLFGVAAFSSIMIGSNLLFQLARYLVELSMPLHLALKIFSFELPGIIVLTFPMSTLLSTLLAFGRLSGNSEIIAFQASGVSFLRLVVPVLIVGLLVSFFTIYVNEGIVPVAKFESRRLVYEFTHNSKIPATQEHLKISQLTKSGETDYLLYAEKFDGEQLALYDVLYVDYEDGRYVSLTHAEKANWLDNQWIFLNGETQHFPEGDEPIVTVKFAQHEMKDITRSPQMLTLSSSQKTTEELTLQELRTLIKDREEQGRDVNKLLVNYYQRFAIPFSCLIFALIGAPLGLQPNRSGSSIGLGLSIIVIFIYYIVLTIGGAIGQTGLIPPLLAAWLPNLIFGIVGLGLNYKVSN